MTGVIAAMRRRAATVIWTMVVYLVRLNLKVMFKVRNMKEMAYNAIFLCRLLVWKLCG